MLFSFQTFRIVSLYFRIEGFMFLLVIMLQELKSVIRAIPEIEELVGSEEANQVFCITEHDEEKVKSVVRTIFTLLMSADPDTTKKIVSKLKRRLHMESQVSHLISIVFSDDSFS